MGSYVRSNSYYPQDNYYHYGQDYSGGFSSGYGHQCCPLVVDPLTLTAILGGIAAATAFFNVLITMTLRRKRKKRDDSQGVVLSGWAETVQDAIHAGRRFGIIRSMFVCENTKKLLKKWYNLLWNFCIERFQDFIYGDMEYF